VLEGFDPGVGIGTGLFVEREVGPVPRRAATAAEDEEDENDNEEEGEEDDAAPCKDSTRLATIDKPGFD
jgi:hypothetical protein